MSRNLLSSTGRYSVSLSPPRTGSSFLAAADPITERFRMISTNGDRPGEVVPTDVNTVPAEDKTLIEVKKVHLDVRKNVLAHHTDGYSVVDSETLVVRRGQEFNITIDFNRPFDKKKDDIRMVFQCGSKPKSSSGSHVELILSDTDKPKEWGAYIENTKENSISLAVNTSPHCAVAKWSLKIDVVKRSDRNIEVYRYKDFSPIYILFNPWCKDDSVYMEDEKKLEEYVLNETGFIYAGNSKRISAKPWSFGQFEDLILDCALFLLEASELLYIYRGDPIAVSRLISKMVNAPDDGGVLVGKWDGNYGDGKSPLEWSGSVEILQQYFKTKAPVKYGQCWVFSGLVTTVCRALGIPTRSVTNFSSAHDTNASITIDSYFDDKTYEAISHLNGDSVWNFHVWNEVWFVRPDLPPGFGGWQIVDATPQETSEGVFCLGPMSAIAIKRGDVNYPFDGRFVFAEVNADKIYWLKSSDGSKRVLRTEKDGVGKNISTKRANSDKREDITDQYKFTEGSEEERAAVRRANVHSNMTYPLYETTAQDVMFEVGHNPDTFMGDQIQISVMVKNTSDSRRTINGMLKLSSMRYTGTLYKEIRKRNIDQIELQPGDEKDIGMVVDVMDYLKLLTDHCFCQISLMCMVAETKQIYNVQDELRLRKPHLDVKGPSKGTVGQKIDISVSFKNPLQVPLTKCKLEVEGPGLQKKAVYKEPNVAAHATYTRSFEMTPMKPGEREIIIYFNCEEISAVNISHPISIVK